MEERSCATCRWRHAPSNRPPCSKCDGYELDKWELFEWEKPVTTEEGRKFIQELLERQKETLAELVGSNMADKLTSEEDEPEKVFPVGDFKKDPKEAMKPEDEREGTMEEVMGHFVKKTPYQLAIEGKIMEQVDKGRRKYGVSLDENDTLTTEQRIDHLEEELIDGLMYCEHLKTVGRDCGITANDYQRAALRTAQVDRLDPAELLLNGAMGLCGESGECIDLIKKTRFQGHALDRDKFLLELGDVAWYLAVAAWGAGFRLSEVFEANINKLKKRYPDGFDKARSMNRGGEGAGEVTD